MSNLRLPKPMPVSDSSYEWKSLFKGSLLSYLVGLYLICFYLELHLRYPILQAVRFQFSFGAIIGVFCLIKFFNNRQGRNISSLTIVTLVLIFWMGIFTVFSYDRQTSITIYNDRVIKYALVAFFIYCGIEKIEDLRVILAAILLVWLKLGQEGFLGWYNGSLVWQNQGIPRLHGSTTMFRHPNSLSGFAVSCLPFCIFFLIAVKSKLMKLGLFALLCCALIMILTTGSRTGYVAVFLSFAALFVNLKNYKFKILLLAVIFSSVSVNFISDSYKERFMSIFTGEEKEGKSSEARLLIISDAVDVFIAHPMGVGVRAFPAVRESMFGRLPDTHNLYLEILTNLGFIGLILFSIFIIQMIKTNVASYRRNLNSSLSALDKNFIQATIFTSIGYIVIRLFLGLFGMDLYEIYWWIGLGLTLACVKLTNTYDKNSSQSVTYRRVT